MVRTTAFCERVKRLRDVDGLGWADVAKEMRSSLNSVKRAYYDGPVVAKARERFLAKTGS